MQAVEIFRKLGAKRDLEKAEAKLSAQAYQVFLRPSLSCANSFPSAVAGNGI